MTAAAAILLQGCAQCADAMRGTPGGFQLAFAHSIVLLIVGGATVFGAGVWLLMRNDR